MDRPLDIPNDAGIIASLFQACRNLLRAALVINNENIVLLEADHCALKKADQALYIWGDRHEVEGGVLDIKLQSYPQLMKTVVMLLNSSVKHAYYQLLSAHDRKDQSSAILQIIEQANIIEQNSDDSDSDADSDDETEATTGPEYVQEALSDTISHLDNAFKCLNDLNMSLLAAGTMESETALHQDLSTAEPQVQPAHWCFYTSIRERFPDLPLTTAELLGRANLTRYQELHQLRTSAEQSSEPIEVGTVGSTSKSEASKSMALSDSAYGTLTQPSAPSIASSLFSGTSRNGGSRWPALPEGAFSRDPFPCAACGRRIVCKTSREYRAHLLRDLQPYSCIVDTCTSTTKPFQSKMLWNDHMVEEHAELAMWKNHECPFCLKKAVGQTHALLSDISKHLEETSLAAIPQDIDDDNPNSDPIEASISRTSAPFEICIANEDVPPIASAENPQESRSFDSHLGQGSAGSGLSRKSSVRPVDVLMPFARRPFGPTEPPSFHSKVYRRLSMKGNQPMSPVLGFYLRPSESRKVRGRPTKQVAEEGRRQTEERQSRRIQAQASQVTQDGRATTNIVSSDGTDSSDLSELDCSSGDDQDDKFPQSPSHVAQPEQRGEAERLSPSPIDEVFGSSKVKKHMHKGITDPDSHTRSAELQDDTQQPRSLLTGYATTSTAEQHQPHNSLQASSKSEQKVVDLDNCLVSCCQCNYGPSLYALHFCCVVCSHKWCGACSIEILKAH